MAVGMTRLAKSRRNVSVDVGPSAAARTREVPPDLVLVALLPPGFSRLGTQLPATLLRSTVVGRNDAFVEHLRFRGRDGLDALPGLDAAVPSRLRDTARLAMGAGARSLDVVVASIPGCATWDLHHPDAVFAVDPMLATLVGAAVVFPDLGGPIPLGPGTDQDVDIRVNRLVRTIEAYAGRWVDRYQVGLLDVPDVSPYHVQKIMNAAANTDSSLVRWRGDELQQRAHGWRSAAGFLGGLLASQPGNVLAAVSGASAPLSGGRRVFHGRRHLLEAEQMPVESTDDDGYFIDVEPLDNGQAVVRSDGLMRSPVGAWSLPAARVAKVIHYRIMQTASRFVFEQADIPRAVALATAVDQAIDPYTQAGLLSGPDGAGAPMVRGAVVRDPASPGLRVDLSAQLRPWAHQVSVRVSLRPGTSPVLEES